MILIPLIPAASLSTTYVMYSQAWNSSQTQQCLSGREYLREAGFGACQQPMRLATWVRAYRRSRSYGRMKEAGPLGWGVVTLV